MTAHTLVHVSDLHLLGDGLLFDSVDCEANLRRFVARLMASDVHPDAIVVTGDVADQAEPEAYVRARKVLDPVAVRLGCPIVWVIGNHDHPEVFRDHLLGSLPINHAVTVGGLRIVALDSTVPGYHHGMLSEETLDWLRDLLATPATHGTVIALHHPPLDSDLGFLGILDLRNRDRLAELLGGTDVRAILAGHWHLSAAGHVAGVPVFVAGATSYSADPGAVAGSFVGVDSAQSYRVTQLSGSEVLSVVVPLAGGPTVTSVPREALAEAAALDVATRDAQWSRFSVTDLVQG